MIGMPEIRQARILIVDDSAVNVQLLVRMLESAGYTAVTSTTDSTVVCAWHREHRYDLILLDVMMPGLDGFEVMRDLRALDPIDHLPVIVLTAQPEHKLRALQDGAKDFISKPFDRLEVLTRINNILEVLLLLRESRAHGEVLEHYDPVTGLPNRVLFRILLSKALERSVDRDGPAVVLHLTIDRFSTLIAALGREHGEVLACRIAERLHACVGPRDTVARLAENAFGLMVLPEPGKGHDAEQLAARVRDCFRSPLNWGGAEIAVTTSIGIALAPTDARDARSLMHHAEIAVHAAELAGQDVVRFYSVAMNARAVEALALENALRRALSQEEFTVHYQPKVRLDTGKWSGAEALLRWHRPGRGMVPPDEFIPMLEETGLIVPVGLWLMRAVCAQIAEWDRRGFGQVRVAVNVSSKQFRREFVPEIAAALAEHGVNPDSLDVEITESSLMARGEETMLVLQELKELGVHIAIDDFGTGYSSLAYLRRFPVDTLKIDISFIRDVVTNADAAVVTRAIIALAHGLNLRVVAEGVETQAQREFLRANDCDEIQGYYFSRPLDASALVELLQGEHASARRVTGEMAASA